MMAYIKNLLLSDIFPIYHNTLQMAIIIFKCKKCGAIRKNKVAEDDNMDEIIALSAREAK